MKTEVRETVNTNVTMYIAYDGTEFKKENECQKYEETAQCAYKSRLAKCLFQIEKIDTILDFLIDGERGEATYYKFIPSKEEDIINFIAYVNTIQYGVVSDYKLCIKAEDLKVGKAYLVCNPYDSTYYYVYDETLAEKYLESFHNTVSNADTDSK